MGDGDVIQEGNESIMSALSQAYPERPVK